jgi:hypothetical protein
VDSDCCRATERELPVSSPPRVDRAFDSGNCAGWERERENEEKESAVGLLKRYRSPLGFANEATLHTRATAIKAGIERSLPLTRVGIVPVFLLGSSSGKRHLLVRDNNNMLLLIADRIGSGDLPDGFAT